MLKDAFDQIARLSGISLSENCLINPNSNAPASNSVSMELSRRFPSLRMPAGSTSVNPTTPTTSSGYSGATKTQPTGRHYLAQVQQEACLVGNENGR